VIFWAGPHLLLGYYVLPQVFGQIGFRYYMPEFPEKNSGSENRHPIWYAGRSGLGSLDSGFGISDLGFG
jgi:hypothetical protein